MLVILNTVNRSFTCKMYRIFFLLLFICNSVSAQFKNSIWIFGDSAGIDFSNVNNPVPIISGMDGRGSSASICDSAGNLLFYAFTIANTSNHSSHVFNSQNSLMSNGDSIMGEAWYNELIILPDPGNQGSYYLFSISTSVTFDPGLFYSKIDMQLNGGLGMVTSKNILLNNLQAFDGLLAFRHGNGRDWWLIFKPEGNQNPPNNDFFVYLISPSGISQPIHQSVGYIITTAGGTISFSKNGDKILMTDWKNLIQVFDFDRCTGLISNPIIVEPEHVESGEHFGNCFSPNGNVIYVTHMLDGANYDSRLYQYDLNAANISASRETLYYAQVPASLAALRLAPDNKVYLSMGYYAYYFPFPDSMYYSENTNLSVVNKPDSVGSACDFQPYSFDLGGKRTYYGLPNNPDYEKGPLLGSICDTLGVGIERPVNVHPALNVYYHSGWQTAFINASRLTSGHYELAVFDISGRKIFGEAGVISNTSFTKDLNCSGVAKGLYIVTLVTDDQKINMRLLIN